MEITFLLGDKENLRIYGLWMASLFLFLLGEMEEVSDLLSTPSEFIWMILLEKKDIFKRSLYFLHLLELH